MHKHTNPTHTHTRKHTGGGSASQPLSTARTLPPPWCPSLPSSCSTAVSPSSWQLSFTPRGCSCLWNCCVVWSLGLTLTQFRPSSVRKCNRQLWSFIMQAFWCAICPFCGVLRGTRTARSIANTGYTFMIYIPPMLVVIKDIDNCRRMGRVTAGTPLPSQATVSKQAEQLAAQMSIESA